MNTNHFTRRTFTATLVTSLVLSTTVARAATSSSLAARVNRLADEYFEATLALFPMNATENLGDAKYEAMLEIEIAPAHIARQRKLYERTLARVNAIDPTPLDADTRFTYELVKYDAADNLAKMIYPWHLTPVSHMDSLPVRLGAWASGKASQPMQTAANYDHFLARLKKLPAWIDQAIVNMKQGMAQGFTLPRDLVERTLPQYDALLPADESQTPYLAGIGDFPQGVSAADRKRITSEYRAVVTKSVLPSVRKLRAFLKDVYMPAARTTAGLGDVLGGAAWYRQQVKSSTTTSMTAAEIHDLGLREVERIRGEMEIVKTKLGFDGTLDAFFASLPDRKDLTPFKTEDEVLDAYRAINEKVKLSLPRLFERAPKAALEIRAVDPMRRETASDNYVPPATDGSRPGVFFAVVSDPLKYKRTTMTSLFLHEGQPGHHYQMAMQRELGGSKFRQGTWYDAYGEGWGLYAESLGAELGMYDDPIAYLGRLFMELHRALRLVVDTGLHDKGWSRVQTIAYLRSKEGSSEASARNATERYMSWPGQALAYKVGELKIIQLRERARTALGPKFDVRKFHTQVLDQGCMPLSMLEAKIDRWIAASKV